MRVRSECHWKEEFEVGECLGGRIVKWGAGCVQHKPTAFSPGGSFREFALLSEFLGRMSPGNPK